MSSSIWDETAGAGNGKVDQISCEVFDVASSLVQSENEDRVCPCFRGMCPPLISWKDEEGTLLKGKWGTLG